MTKEHNKSAWKVTYDVKPIIIKTVILNLFMVGYYRLEKVIEVKIKC